MLRLYAFFREQWLGVIRAKGFFWLASRPDFAGEMSMAGSMIRHQAAGLWWVAVPKSRWPDDPGFRRWLAERDDRDYGDRRQELVFIGIGMDEPALWWNRFGPRFAAEIRRRRAGNLRAVPQWRWHLDEVFVNINGEMHYPWRAVDHEGEVREVFATKRRDRKAALAFLKRAMKRYGRPQAIVTDRCAPTVPR